MENATLTYHPTTLIKVADGLGFAYLTILLVLYTVYHFLLRKRGGSYSRISNWVTVLLACAVFPYFVSFVGDLSILTPSLGVSILFWLFKLFAIFLWLYALMMLAVGSNIVTEDLTLENRQRLKLLYILGGIVLVFSIAAIVVAFVGSAWIGQLVHDHMAHRMDVQIPAGLAVAIVLIPVLFVLLLLAFVITYLVRFIRATFDTREQIAKLAISPQRRLIFDTKYKRFLIVALICVVLTILFAVCQIFVLFWNVGRGADAIRLLNVFLSAFFETFVAFIFRLRQSEDFKLYTASDESFEIEGYDEEVN